MNRKKTTVLISFLSLSVLGLAGGCLNFTVPQKAVTSVAGGSTQPSSPPASIEADVSVVDTNAGTIQVLGTSPGILVLTDANTAFDDKRDGLDPLTLADLKVNDHLKISVTVDNTILARQVTRTEASDDDTALLGPAENVSSADSTFTLMGVTMTTDDHTVYQDLAQNAITHDDFFSSLQPGVTVGVTGFTQKDGTFLATEATSLGAK